MNIGFCTSTKEIMEKNNRTKDRGQRGKTWRKGENIITLMKIKYLLINAFTFKRMLKFYTADDRV